MNVTIPKFVFPFALTFTLVGCGSDALFSHDNGTPPDASMFDPGTGRGGDGYGSGGQTPGGPGSTFDAGAPPTCSDDLKRCASEFTFPVGTETSVELRGDYRGADSWIKGDTMTKSGDLWKVTVPVPYGKAVQYKFCTNGCPQGTPWVLDPTPGAKTISDGNGNTNSLRDPLTCEKFTCDEPPVPPQGVFDWRDSVMYFVFVDRFLDGDPTNNCTVANVSGAPGQYQGGDWKGVKRKIDDGYFTDLGVNTLWLTVPIDNTNERGQGVGGDSHYYSAYHGYWPKELDPAHPEECFGTAQDLKDMISAAHAKDIKILFDYAMVHVHATSTIFRDHKDWFWTRNGGDPWCICGDNNCSWDTLNGEGKKCWFTPYLPHWNYTSSAARDYSVQNAIDWAREYKIDGFRLDAIKHVDDSWLAQLRTKLGTEIVANQTPPQRFYLVGETFSYDRNELRYYVDPNSKLDGQFDFPERMEITKAVLARFSGMDGLAAFMDSNDSAYGSSAVMSPFVGNHDIGRVIHMAEDTPLWNEYSSGDKDRAWSNTPGQPSSRSAYERLANGFAVIFTNKGAPLVYYGDEIGLAGAGDPDNRRFMPWSGLDANQTFLRDRVKKLTKIRADHPALRRGRRTTLEANANLWVFSQTVESDTVYVAINRGDSDVSTNKLPSGALDELVTTTTATGPSASVPARQTRIWVAK